MQADVTKTYYFHADANALGGFVEEPFRVIPSQASVGLPSVGGAANSRAKRFKFEKIVSCKSTYTHVAGRPLKRNGPWIERVTSVVEGLNILGVLACDRAVARVFIERQSDGNLSRVSFAGSYFQNLRLYNKPLQIVINQKLMPTRRDEGKECYNEDAPFTTEVDWPVLWNVAQEQSESLRNLPGVPDWVVERYGRIETSEESRKGYTVCSLVDKIEGVSKGAQSFNHILEVPDVGRFFFGEPMVLPQSVQLTMIRAELGCKVNAQISAATSTTNGHPWPPGK